MSYETKLLKKSKYLKRVCVNFNLTNIKKIIKMTVYHIIPN